jgi:Domain of unknown function (DUF4440)
MKNNMKIKFTHRQLFILGLINLIIISSATAQIKTLDVDKELAERLSSKDSLIFTNILSTCDIDGISDLFSDDFVFLQTEGDGIYTTRIPREQFLSNSKSFCERINTGGSKMKRVVLKNTLQTFYLNDSWIIQIGTQNFFSSVPKSPDILREVSTFTNTWQKQGNEWKLSRQFIKQEKLLSNQLDNPIYDTIAKYDSILFSGINNRNLDVIKSMYNKRLEFYHDRGGKMDYNDIVKINKENFAKENEFVREELKKETLRIYPMGDFGAIEVGTHYFYTKIAGEAEKLTSSPDFIQIWEKENGQWKVTRVISYGHY